MEEISKRTKLDDLEELKEVGNTQKVNNLLSNGWKILSVDEDKKLYLLGKYKQQECQKSDIKCKTMEERKNRGMEEKLKEEMDRLIKINKKLEEKERIDLSSEIINKNILTMCEIVKTLSNISREEMKKILKKYFDEIKDSTDKEVSIFNKQKNILTMCEIVKTIKIIDD